MGVGLNYLEHLEFFGVKLGLERMRQLMVLVGHPEQKFKIVHIAGTNGKGSVAAMVASILRCAGYKVGLYTSPHLVRFNERIIVNGAEISDGDLEGYVNRLRTLNECENVGATYFEFTTALAFLYFADCEVEIAIVETGLGGRLDATNVVHADVAVITSIGLDHKDHLGSTLVDIALEKAGVIKDRSTVVVGNVSGPVFSVIKEKSRERHAQLVRVHDKYNNDVGLRGDFQKWNAAVAAAAVKALVSVDDYAIVKGLKDVKWSGRLEYLRDNLLVDCAHNPSGMKELCEYIVSITKKKVLVLGIAEDKDALAMVQQIVPLVDGVIITEGSYKPLNSDTLSKIVEKYNNNVLSIKNSSKAIEKALEIVNDGVVVVTGSIYLVGDVMKDLNSDVI